MTQIHALPRPSAAVSFAGLRLLLSVLLALFTFTFTLTGAEASKKAFDVPAGDAAVTLKQFAQQAGQQVVYPAHDVKGVKTSPVKGDYTLGEALNVMLAGTGLVAALDEKSSTFAVSRDPGPNAPRLARKNSDQPGSEKSETKDGVLKLETFEVMGTKLLNMDIRRSRDDAQPYVVFERETLGASGATNIEEFLKQRLSMNTTTRSNEQQVSLLGSTSRVNLRGLGASQTLILIDGHRVAANHNQGIIQQGDLNSIPFAAVERIEVLPTTASGIYGGSATGGVINVVLRRDYSGAEISLGYENSFATDASTSRVDFNAGLNFHDGRTNMLFAGSWSSANQLRAQDTGLVTAGRAAILANNPAFFLNNASVPAGATPNIRSGNGSDLVLKNGTPLNSPRTYIPLGYAGPAIDGGAALVANAGRYNFDLAPNAQNPGGALAGLLAAPERKNFSATLRHQFSPQVQVFLDLALSDSDSVMPTNSGSLSFSLPVGAPNNPFTTAITVQTGSIATDGVLRSVQRDRRAIAGVIVQLPSDWKAEADFTWNRNKFERWNQLFVTSAAGTAIATGTPNIMRDLNLFPLDLSAYAGPILTEPVTTKFLDLAVRLAGPVATLPAGPVMLSSLAEFRDEDLSDELTTIPALPFTSYAPARSQSIHSGYLEARIPVLGGDRRAALARELELQLAARHDRYTVNATTAVLSSVTAPIGAMTTKRDSTDITLGLRYVPVESVAIRASFGTGFVPPSPRQLVATPFDLSVAGLTDPKRGNSAVPGAATGVGGVGVIPTVSGGSPTLRPEQSESWSAGAVITPRRIPGLRLSVDYTRIEKEDNIITLSAQVVINNEDSLPGRVRRGAVPSGDPFTVGPINFVDFSLVNLAETRLDAYDIQLDYTARLPAIGELEFYAAATRQMHFKTRLTPISPVVENVGVGDPFGVNDSPPLKFKGNGGVTWRRGGWSATWVARHYDSYLVSTNATQILNQGNGGRVPSQTYHDLSVQYRFGAGAGPRWMKALLARAELQVGVKNVFNLRPPLDAANTQFFYSYHGDPRLSGYFLKLKKTL